MKHANTPINMHLADAFNKNDFDTLLKHENASCISIYIPTHRGGKESLQNAIRFRNAVEKVKPLVPAIDLGPVMALLDNGNAGFWQYQKDGFALFMSSELMRAFRLSMDTPEVAVVADQFHLKPVLPLVVYDTTFFILALSQNECRLYQCAMQHCYEIKPENLPDSLSQALRFDLQEKQLQSHTASQTSQAPGRKAAAFHGQGIADDEDKDRILRYFQAINKALTTFLGPRTDPLVLAGVDYLHALYRSANTYPHLVNEGITGNPENLTAQDLQKAAWKIVTPCTRKDLDRAVKAYQDLKGSGKTANDLAHILQQAPTGQMKHLMVARDVHQWGQFSWDEGPVFHSEKQPQDQDLLNVAACHALRNGATVFPVPLKEMPDDSPAAAVFY
ncbi:MAG: hypothetical protein K9K21_12740 [Desulfotignum sp.]|nr:hypothetical protein [Desulfotignum sp.]MCF8114709.1 hypothetical protein [Desulfotignum sp.]